jgi:hypothetical protein
VAGCKYVQTFAAGPISDDFILGVDFWLQQKGVINLPRQCVSLEGKEVPIIMMKMHKGEWFHVSQVVVADSQRIKPQCQTAVKVCLLNPAKVDFVTEPFCSQNLLGSSGIISSQDGLSWLEVINDSEEVVHLKAGEKLATAVELKTVFADASCLAVRNIQLSGTCLGTETKEETNKLQEFLPSQSWDQVIVQAQLTELQSSLPEQLQQLFKNSCKELDVTQQYALAKVLSEYKDTFAKSDEDLGQFDY